MDKLDHIFELQKELNDRIGFGINPFNQEEKIQWILNVVRALQQELAEIVDAVPWKWWAHYQTFDEQNVRVELVDVLHFLVLLAQILGLSAEDIYQLYLQKNKVNLDRLKTGYTTKDKNDSRHIILPSDKEES